VNHKRKEGVKGEEDDAANKAKYARKKEGIL